jgi:hypothetical protein
MEKPGCSFMAVGVCHLDFSTALSYADGTPSTIVFVSVFMKLLTLFGWKIISQMLSHYILGSSHSLSKDRKKE